MIPDLENPHSCGACGYDGGVSHAKEIGELNTKVAKLQSRNPASGGDKMLFLTVSFFLLSLFSWLSWNSYISPADIIQETHVHESPYSKLNEDILESYQICLRSARGHDERQVCGDSFSEGQRRVLKALEEQALETNGVAK